MRFYTIILTLLCFANSLAQPPVIQVDQDDFSRYIIPDVEYKLVDKQWEEGGVLSDTGWLRTNKKALNFGMTNKGCWVRFKVDKTCDQALRLSVETKLLSTSNFFELKQNELIKVSTSNQVDNFWSIVLEDNRSYYILMYLRPYPSSSIPIFLTSESNYKISYSYRLIFFGFLTGGFVLIVLYNLLLALTSRLKVFLFYALYALTTYLAQSSTSSFLLSFLEKNTLYQPNIYLFIFIGCVALTAGPFLFFFLTEDNTSYRKLSARVLFTTPVLGIMIIIIGLIDQELAYPFVNFSMILVALICFLFPLFLWTKGNNKAVFIIIAWTPFLTAACVYILTNLGLINYTSFTPYLMPLGASLETILLSLALGYRIRKLKEDQHKAELAVIRENGRTQELETQVFKFRMDALRSQLNPHLMFNALSSIKSSIINNEPKRAESLIQKIALLMRDSLDISRKEAIPLSREIRFATDYMELEQMKGNVEFEFIFTYHDNLENEDPYIPANMLQPLCENAIKHAFKTSNNEKNVIEIILRKRKRNLVYIQIIDNGTGFIQSYDLKARRSYGISIVRERLDMLLSYGYEAMVDIVFESKESKNHGTTVNLVLPML